MCNEWLERLDLAAEPSSEVIEASRLECEAELLGFIAELEAGA
ncbi:hypothetical protein [Nannocystis bainbridge]|uniref:Uncharacterized protein n=1 Tax=Nannocystis bainbridge TaxID=2995303 RepID=A0ABT5E0Z8_9BACT|nr:hypothetical protein [Nannocystis bainbridge]MDC0719098.1 hypothetical protein [Nannocystis bainbridge]